VNTREFFSLFFFFFFFESVSYSRMIRPHEGLLIRMDRGGFRGG